MNNILFINLYFKIGGVETLLLRIIRALNVNGYNSTVLLLRKEYDENLLCELRAVSKVVFLSDIFSIYPHKIKESLGFSFKHIFVTINDALLLGAVLQRLVYPKAHLIAGVYQTEIFCAPVTWRYLHRKVIQDIFCHVVPHNNKIIANEAARDYHQNKLGCDLSASKIVPLIVDVEKYYPPVRGSVNRKKIVSIGRLVDFKTYNLTFFDVLLSFNQLGHYFEWHVYGDGPLESEMKRLIKVNNLEKQVFLHGPLDYALFKSVVSDAFVFIGSGTAIIEAAACGVPVIPAIEYADKPVSYGFFHEIDGISFFEPGLNISSFNIFNAINNLVELNSEGYIEVQCLSIKKASTFKNSLVINSYLAALNGSHSNEPLFLVSVLSFAFRFVVSKLLAFFK